MDSSLSPGQALIRGTVWWWASSGGSDLEAGPSLITLCPLDLEAGPSLPLCSLDLNVTAEFHVSGTTLSGWAAAFSFFKTEQFLDPHNHF